MKYLMWLFVIILASCSNSGKSIKIKSSDTEVNMALSLAGNFYKVNQDFLAAVSGGGSGLGIASLLNGQTDIANSLRTLDIEERSLLKVRGLSDTNGQLAVLTLSIQPST
ncbi:MAG: hypothetical protein V4520_12095 [Bacteroidota bacterium]